MLRRIISHHAWPRTAVRIPEGGVSHTDRVALVQWARGSGNQALLIDEGAIGAIEIQNPMALPRRVDFRVLRGHFEIVDDQLIGWCASDPDR